MFKKLFRTLSSLFITSVKFLLSAVCYLLVAIWDLFWIALPSIMVFVALNLSSVLYTPLPNMKRGHQDAASIFIPHTKWGVLKPCGSLFNEQKQFNLAKQCVNKVWKNRVKDNILIPRCYVIPTDSPDVYSDKDGSNFVAVQIAPGVFGAAVGYYEEETMTLFIVENLDSHKTYRHELQHHFLKVYEGDGDGEHDDPVWDSCEPQFYTPSLEGKLITGLRRNFDK